MNKHDQSLRRLVEAARRAPLSGDEAAPFGFSTRVAARAFDAAPASSPSFARLSLRVAGIACLFAVAAVGVNFRAIASALDDETAVAAGDDPVSDVVSLDS
ncbi:MAG TPA: hypothetical protein VN877_07285 [Opitutaceae bacterium]|nr:hypothetical protein [Opitutaceae bacterium]